MTIDEAIIHCEEVAIRKLKNGNNANCVRCGEEHVQLAKWLKELRDYKSREDVVPVVRCRDCKFRENDDFCTGRGFPCQLVPDDGFCDKGERKE